MGPFPMPSEVTVERSLRRQVSSPLSEIPSKLQFSKETLLSTTCSWNRSKFKLNLQRETGLACPFPLTLGQFHAIVFPFFCRCTLGYPGYAVIYPHEKLSFCIPHAKKTQTCKISRRIQKVQWCFLTILGSRVDLPSADFSAKLVSFDTAWTFSTEYLDNRTAV